MRIMLYIRHLIRSQVSARDVLYFVQGQFRYLLYYSSNKVLYSLMRNHIREQIRYRIRIMNSTCYNSGSCIYCGCATTALQMASKTCDGGEYPPMVNSTTWKLFVEEGLYIADREKYWTYNPAIINKE